MRLLWPKSDLLLPLDKRVTGRVDASTGGALSALPDLHGAGREATRTT